MVMFLVTLYATLRYIVFKGVDIVHFPLYITNKVVSVAGIFFLAVSYVLSKFKIDRLEENGDKTHLIRVSGLTGFSLSSIHVFMTLIMLNPSYYPKLYDGDMMNFKGELSMAMGVLSLFFFTIPAITTLPFMQEAVGIKKWQTSQRIGYLGLLTALLHVLVMGVSGWLDVQKWPGYLPPLTLISAVIAIVPLYLKLVKRN